MSSYVSLVLFFLALHLSAMELNTIKEQPEFPARTKAVTYLKNLGIGADEMVLELECGHGKTTQEISRLVPKGYVIGVDSSQAYIATAKEKRDNAHILNAFFYVMEPRRLNFVNFFDRIISLNRFEEIPHQEGVLNNCAKALKSGGHLHIRVSADISCRLRLTTTLFKIKQKEKWKNTLRLMNVIPRFFPLNESEAREMLERVPLEPQEITLSCKPSAVKTIKQLHQAIKLLAYKAFPFIYALNGTEQKEFLEEFVTHFKQLMPTHEDGSINTSEQILTIIATKK